MALREHLTPLLGALALALATASTALGQPVEAEANPESETAEEAVSGARLPLEDLRLFADVFNQVRRAYVEETTDTALLENAIKGMLQGLDPHSAFLDAASFDNLQSHTSGEFGGLGLEIGMENGFVKVVSPIDDTPASRAGIEAGDLIIELDGRSVKGMSLQEAVGIMRGKKGSSITLKIVRDGSTAPLDFTLLRDVITVRSVRQKILEPGYGYLRIAQFQSKTGESFQAALRELQADKTPLRGIVLDLRNNPGGLLNASVDIVDNFISEGLIVYTEGRMKTALSEFQAKAETLVPNLPLVVLINGGSASASEIVAGALQDHGRAVIMGTRSFGKGSVQTVLPLSQERAIKLTTARYYTPKGRSIQAQGIEPDIEVKRAKVEQLDAGNRLTEADLSGHLSNDEGEEKNRNQRAKEDKKDAPLSESDNQLFEALNVLKGITIIAERKKNSAGAG